MWRGNTRGQLAQDVVAAGWEDARIRAWSSDMRRRSAKRAFTLIEMLAVIAIIMLVMALALPNFMAMMKHQRWVAAIGAFQNVVRRCRIFAINERLD